LSDFITLIKVHTYIHRNIRYQRVSDTMTICSRVTFNNEVIVLSIITQKDKAQSGATPIKGDPIPWKRAFVPPLETVFWKQSTTPLYSELV
jgi:hypothetical protein